MKTPEIPFNESQRLEALKAFRFEDLNDREDFDFLTELAAKLTGAENVLISLVFEKEQWILSQNGRFYR